MAKKSARVKVKKDIAAAPEHVALEKIRDEEFKDNIRTRKKKMEAQQNKRGVVLLSHIPHGFFEPQMFSFFNQFGDVTRLKLIRSKKTGKPRHFAFIEFQFEEVARIAAQTMNNYLMFRKILKCKLIPSEEVKSTTFKNWQNIYRFPKTRRQAIKLHNADQTDPAKIESKLKKTTAKRERLQKKLTDLEIDYDIFKIKANESFVPPERTRAKPEDIADANAPIGEYAGEVFSEFEDDDDEEEEEEVNSSKNVESEDSKSKENVKTINNNKKDDQISSQTKIQSKDEGEFGVMVVDLEDPEITFKSLPTEARIRRKSMGVSKATKNYIYSPKPETNLLDHGNETPKQKRLRKMKQLELALESSDEDDESQVCESKPKKSPATSRVKRKVPSTDKKPKAKKSKFNRTM